MMKDKQKDSGLSHSQAIIAHFIRRSGQRFRLRFNEGDYRGISKKIRHGECIFEKNKSNGSVVIRLFYKNKHIRCVYDKNAGRLMTAIPIKNPSLENELRKLFGSISNEGNDIVFEKNNHQLVVSKKLNRVLFRRFVTNKRYKREYCDIASWGYPEKSIRKIDEILTCVNRAINPLTKPILKIKLSINQDEAGRKIKSIKDRLYDNVYQNHKLNIYSKMSFYDYRNLVREEMRCIRSSRS